MTEKDIEQAAYDWTLANPPGLDPVCGDNGYPTEIELQRIEHWFDDKPTDWNESLIGLITYVRERWNYRDWGWHEADDKDGTRFYSISTGGWSGNESLMSAMEKNWVFWALMFDSHRAGGHYILKLKPRSNRNDPR